MVNKKLTIEQARDILNKSYRVFEYDYFCSPGEWYIKYNRNNNNSESDFHALEERFLYYSRKMPELIDRDDGNFAVGSGNRLFWENDIQNITAEEFIKVCNREFATIIDGSERNKLYKEHIKKCIEEERKRTRETQERFDLYRRKEKIANNIFNTILFIVMVIVLWTLITVW